MFKLWESLAGHKQADAPAHAFASEKPARLETWQILRLTDARPNVSANELPLSLRGR